MTVNFETKSEKTALDYIKIHLQEGYIVTAYVDGYYYWEKVYKIRASLITDLKEDSQEKCKTCKWGDVADEQHCGICGVAGVDNYESRERSE